MRPRGKAVVRGSDRRADQRGIDQRAGAHDEAGSVQLTADLGKQRLPQAGIPERTAKPAQAGLVRRSGIQRQPAEPPERYPVRQRFLQPRVRQPVPLRQQQRPQHRQRWPGRTPHRTGAHLPDQRLQRRPVDQLRYPLQPRIAPKPRRQKRSHQTKLLAIASAPAHPERITHQQSKHLLSQSTRPDPGSRFFGAGCGRKRGCGSKSGATGWGGDRLPGGCGLAGVGAIVMLAAAGGLLPVTRVGLAWGRFRLSPG